MFKIIYFLLLNLFLNLDYNPVSCISPNNIDLVTPLRSQGEACGYESCPKPDNARVNVHIVPHTHAELGRSKTFTEYYTGYDEVYGDKTRISMKRILDGIVAQLWKDGRRKFAFADMSYFFNWWANRDGTVHRMVYELIRQGRLFFVGGGWSMSDEATTNYQAIIDQYTYALRKLNDSFLECGRPLVAWQSECMGHSKEFASLLAQMGFDGLFINPISYDDELRRMRDNEMEFLWRGSDDLGMDSDIYTNKLFDGYWSPPGFCFSTACKDPLLVTTDFVLSNIKERAAEFISTAKFRQAPYYRTKHVMIMMGMRQGYFDAEMWFANIDKLINNVNEISFRQNEGVILYYSSPACYLKAVHDSNPSLGTYQDDFFPYAHDKDTFLTGMYTSRPTLKYLINVANSHLQMAKQLQITANLIDFSAMFEKYKWIMGVIQDHTLITGAHTEPVGAYYKDKLCEVMKEATWLVTLAFNYLRKSPPMYYYKCSLNESTCPNLNKEKAFMVIYNPLAWPVTTHVRIPISIGRRYVIYDPVGREIPACLMPIPEPVLVIPGRQTLATVELVFIAEDIPPMGYRSYYSEHAEPYVSRYKREAKFNNNDDDNLYDEEITEKTPEFTRHEPDSNKLTVTTSNNIEIILTTEKPVDGGTEKEVLNDNNTEIKSNVGKDTVNTITSNPLVKNKDFINKNTENKLNIESNKKEIKKNDENKDLQGSVHNIKLTTMSEDRMVDESIENPELYSNETESIEKNEIESSEILDSFVSNVSLSSSSNESSIEVTKIPIQLFPRNKKEITENYKISSVTTDLNNIGDESLNAKELKEYTEKKQQMSRNKKEIFDHNNDEIHQYRKANEIIMKKGKSQKLFITSVKKLNETNGNDISENILNSYKLNNEKGAKIVGSTVSVTVRPNDVIVNTITHKLGPQMEVPSHIGSGLSDPISDMESEDGKHVDSYNDETFIQGGESNSYPLRAGRLEAASEPADDFVIIRDGNSIEVPLEITTSQPYRATTRSPKSTSRTILTTRTPELKTVITTQITKSKKRRKKILNPLKGIVTVMNFAEEDFTTQAYNNISTTEFTAKGIDTKLAYIQPEITTHLITTSTQERTKQDSIEEQDKINSQLKDVETTTVYSVKTTTPSVERKSTKTTTRKSTKTTTSKLTKTTKSKLRKTTKSKLRKTTKSKLTKTTKSKSTKTTKSKLTKTTKSKSTNTTKRKSTRSTKSKSAKDSKRISTGHSKGDSTKSPSGLPIQRHGRDKEKKRPSSSTESSQIATTPRMVQYFAINNPPTTTTAKRVTQRTTVKKTIKRMGKVKGLVTPKISTKHIVPEDDDEEDDDDTSGVILDDEPSSTSTTPVPTTTTELPINDTEDSETPMDTGQTEITDEDEPDDESPPGYRRIHTLIDDVGDSDDEIPPRRTQWIVDYLVTPKPLFPKAIATPPPNITVSNVTEPPPSDYYEDYEVDLNINVTGKNLTQRELELRARYLKEKLELEKRAKEETKRAEELERIRLSEIRRTYDYRRVTHDYIENQYIRVLLSRHTGRTISITLKNNITMKLDIQFYYYDSDEPKKLDRPDQRQPGAFVFRPLDPQPNIIKDGMKTKVFKNNIVQEVHTQFSDYASYVLRLYNNSVYLEVDWVVGPVPIADGLGKEVFIRYTTDLEHQGVFYTDANGRQTMKRIRDTRSTFVPFKKDPISGNIYPVTSKISIEDTEKNIRFSVLNDRPQGGTSLKDGEVDLFIHRRILTDDSGIFAFLNETQNGIGLIVRGKHYIYVAKNSQKTNRIFEKKLQKQINLPPQFFASSPNPYNVNFKSAWFIWLGQNNEFSALNSKLPLGIHFLSLEPVGKNQILIRLENFLERTDLKKDGIRTVYLSNLFKNLKLEDMKETTLAANQWLEKWAPLQWRKDRSFFKSFNEAYGNDSSPVFVEGPEYLKPAEFLSIDDGIVLKPQEIRTFICTYTYVPTKSLV